MKAALVFLAGIAAGVVLMLGGMGWNRFGVCPESPGGFQDVRIGEILRSLKSIQAELGTLILDLETPSHRILRLPVSRSWRISHFNVVVAQLPPSLSPPSGPVQSVLSGNATVPEPDALAEKSSPQPQVRQAAAPPRPAPADNLDPQKLYAQALRDYEQGEFARSRELFGQFTRRFHAHPLKPNALYWTGETWYAQHHYEEASRSFAEVVRLYPRHSKSPDALLKLAYAAMRQGRIEQARAYLDRLEAGYPGAPAARLGRKARANLDRRSETAVQVVARG